MRVTWKAVTTGTPNCSTFAVIAISAIPPGVVPRIKVGTGATDQYDSSAPSPNANAKAPTVNVATTAIKRGAARKKSGR
ncbi:hypothetical protein G6F62_015343 [Rhizopus arrhizus]|uniref:Uncharacterized protein n=1 Tax=Rhizopus delemar TaxID=936053 RepID=A0A9P6XLN9_9FUNG|nr:hypothetical protein G6F62_015343 [Rhizopus arrhizus]KAG1521636.1 hypothetical protein G6F50_018718 [Rhizopus delemar]KAG1585755.1 hypothetical protein G6F46_014822 [Rhizopus delemar]